MAVVKSKRGENELDVVTDSRELAVYTIRICSNEKNFPKRYRWCITNEIVKSVNVIHSSILKSNEVYVKDRSDYELRKRYQNMALAEIGSLLGSVDIAFGLFGIDEKKMLHWTGLGFPIFI